MIDNTPLSDLRKSYEQGTLDEHETASEPLLQFQSWLAEALKRGIPEPNAMTLATVGESGRPSSRPVLIKDCDERGVVWYSNYTSRKGRELASNPYAALQFHWLEMERVVRIEGRVEKVSDEESDAYFATRPLNHRIGAWASPQSEVIAGRSILVARAVEYGLKFGFHPPRPMHWGGYRLKPDYWEFWQGRSSRLHDRIAYRLQPDGSWVRERLAP
ncbi:pyridoxamine 5'-phosphate oxidase [Propionivibrio sp.]|uniref:pyridoxamine 5'-phosphate oxidase n=1 Tax=Propionivibrio sp. TaxID=2212460 RepID=UPI003BEFC1B6